MCIIDSILVCADAFGRSCFVVPIPDCATWPAVSMLLAVVVTASVQLVGVYIVFATLILPPWGTNTRRSHKAVGATAESVFTFLLGISAPTLADLPAGPSSVLLYALTAVAIRVGLQSCRSSLESANA